MPLSCVSAPALTEEERQEALEAKFFAAGSTRTGRSSSRADMSPSYADDAASVSFDTPDGTHALAKRWTHPDGPRPFHPRCSPRAVVAQVPGAKKHRCLLVNVGDALVVHNFNPRLGDDESSAYHTRNHNSPPPIRVLTFQSTTVTAVAHRELLADDVHEPDVLVGLGNGEVLLLSLRALIADRDGKALPPGTKRFNTDGGGGVGGSGRIVRDLLSHQEDKSAGGKTAARCTSVHWFLPTIRDVEIAKDSEGNKESLKARDLFLSTHADGNAYVYSAALGDDRDPRFASLRGSNAVNAVSLTMATGFLDGNSDNVGETGEVRTKSPNPFARMRVGAAALTAAAVAPGGEAVALAAADGQVRVLDVRRVASGDVALVDGFKSHFGGVDAVAWAEGPPDSHDDDDDDDERRAEETKTNRSSSPRLGRFRLDVCLEPGPATPRFLLAGGEADVVEVWDRPRRALAARARGHASWIAHVAETPPRVAVGATKSDEEKSDALFAAEISEENTVDKKSKSTVSTYDDLLGEADKHTRRLRFASVAQDCRVCFWEMDVDQTPAWWVPVARTFCEIGISARPEALSARDSRFETVKRSANVDVPGGRATERAASDALDENEKRRFSFSDEDEAPPFVPSRVALGAAPEAEASAADLSVLPPPEKTLEPTSSVPSSSLTTSSLMFPTLREELSIGAPEDTTVAGKKTTASAVSSEDVFGDGRVVARAASSRSTPSISPFSTQLVHAEPCTSLAFVNEGVLTTCGGGVVKLWRRT
jgi:hypothetical protein